MNKEKIQQELGKDFEVTWISPTGNHVNLDHVPTGAHIGLIKRGRYVTVWIFKGLTQTRLRYIKTMEDAVNKLKRVDIRKAVE